MPKIQKLQLLLQKKDKIDQQINQLKEQNVQSLASSLCKISEIENLDIAVILGATLKAVKNIQDDEKEVLRNSGKTFLKKYKAIPYSKTNAKEK
jgi:hypothetical protein